MPKRWVCLSLALFTGLVLLAGCGAGQTPAPTAKPSLLPVPMPTAVTEPAGWKLVWQDEFDGQARAQPVGQNWDYDSGGSGWNVSERQYYTTTSDNAALDGNGILQITARQVVDPYCDALQERLIGAMEGIAPAK